MLNKILRIQYFLASALFFYVATPLYAGDLIVVQQNVTIMPASNPGDGTNQEVVDQQNFISDFNNKPNSDTVVITQDNIANYTDVKGNIIVTSQGDITLSNNLLIDTPGSITINSGNALNLDSTVNTGTEPSLNITAISNNIQITGSFNLNAGSSPLVITPENLPNYADNNGNIVIVSQGDIILNSDLVLDTPGSVAIQGGTVIFGGGNGSPQNFSTVSPGGSVFITSNSSVSFEPTGTFNLNEVTVSDLSFEDQMNQYRFMTQKNAEEAERQEDLALRYEKLKKIRKRITG